MEIKREGVEALLTLKYKYPLCNWAITLRHNFGTEFNAILAIENLQESYKAQIRRAKEDAYNDGWKDAKAKRMKCTYFNGSL